MPELKLVRRGWLLDAETDTLRSVDILIEGDTIRDVVPGGSVGTANAETIEADRYVLVPGLVNGHTHSTGNLAKGLGERWTLELQLNASNFLYRDRRPEEKYLSALIGALDMVSGGATACYDLMFEWPSPSVEGVHAVAQAYDEVGLRAVIAPMLSSESFYAAVPGLLRRTPAALAERAQGKIDSGDDGATLRRCEEILRVWPARSGARPGLAPSIPLHCSDVLLRGCARLAETHGCTVHTHLAESKVQAIKSEEKFGRSATARLAQLGLLGPRLVAAHAVWLDDSDIGRLADSGTAVVLNPASNMRLGSGVAPARRLRTAGVTLGLGTDSAICSDSLNMFVAMRFAGLAYGLHGYDREQWLTPLEVFRMATAEGAKAIGREREIGRIAKGYKADIVFVDRESLAFVPVNAPTAQLVRCEEGRGLRHVMIGGRFAWYDGRPRQIDLSRVAREAARAAERLQAVSRLTQGDREALESIIDRFCASLASRRMGIERHVGRSHGTST